MRQKNGSQSVVSKLLGDYIILLPILLLIVIWTVVAPNFLTSGNFMNVLRQVSMVAIIAAGQYFIICSGYLDLSLGAVVGLSGIIFAKAMVDWNIPIILSVVLCLLTGMLCCFINGFLITQFSLPGFVATL